MESDKSPVGTSVQCLGLDEVLRRIALRDGVFVMDEGPVRRARKSDRCRLTARHVIDSRKGQSQISEDE